MPATRFLLLGALVAGLAYGATAPAGISLRSRYHFGFEPATVRVTVIVPQNAGNRAVCLVLDGGLYTSSCWQVDGESPVYTDKEYRDLPAGVYVISGVLRRSPGGDTHPTPLHFEVLSRK